MGPCATVELLLRATGRYWRVEALARADALYEEALRLDRIAHTHDDLVVRRAAERERDRVTGQAFDLELAAEAR